MGDNNLVIMFEHGGWIFYGILGLSVVALGLVIERMLWLMRCQLRDEVFYKQLADMVEQGAPREELESYCRADESNMAELTRFALNHSSLGLLSMRRLVLDHFNDEIKPRLEANLNWLGVIGRTAPMLGLFGTVYGMMGAFNQMAKASTQARPQDLAGDINIALATTVGGLFVALVVIAFHSFLQHRVRDRARLYQRRIGALLKPFSEMAEAEELSHVRG